MYENKLFSRPDSDEPSRVQGDKIERWYLFVQWTPRDIDAAKDLKSEEKRSLYLMLNAVAGFISPPEGYYCVLYLVHFEPPRLQSSGHLSIDLLLNPSQIKTVQARRART